MRAQIVAMTSENLDMDAIKRAGDILKAGGLVAFPTETVYGLGGNALDPQASMKIYAAKGRPSDNPLIVHIAEIDQLAKITTEIPAQGKILAEKYWPGPLTMILPKGTLQIPKRSTEDWTVWLSVSQVTGSHRNLSKQPVVLLRHRVPAIRRPSPDDGRAM